MFTPLLHDFFEFSIIKNKKDFRKYLLLLFYIYIERERDLKKKHNKKFVGKSLISSSQHIYIYIEEETYCKTVMSYLGMAIFPLPASPRAGFPRPVKAVVQGQGKMLALHHGARRGWVQTFQTHPAPPLPVPTPLHVIKGYNCKFFVP